MGTSKNSIFDVGVSDFQQSRSRDGIFNAPRLFLLQHPDPNKGFSAPDSHDKGRLSHPKRHYANFNRTICS